MCADSSSRHCEVKNQATKLYSMCDCFLIFRLISGYFSLFQAKTKYGGIKTWWRFAGCNRAGVGLDFFAASLNLYHHS